MSGSGIVTCAGILLNFIVFYCLQMNKRNEKLGKNCLLTIPAPLNIVLWGPLCPYPNNTRASGTQGINLEGTNENNRYQLVYINTFDYLGIYEDSEQYSLSLTKYRNECIIASTLLRMYCNKLSDLE